MRNHILRRIICLVLFCLLLCCPIQVFAHTIINPNLKCSLTLHYTQEALSFENLEISIHRVGEVFANNSYALVAPYSDYPVDIQGLTSPKEWQDAATTLKAYITQNQQPADRTALTDAAGSVSFTGLQTGLYLVSGVTCETETTTYTFGDFLIFLPRTEGTVYNYDVDAMPKFSQSTPKPEEEYSVLKLWQDGENSENRPVSIVVDIMKNGELYETVILNAENNWFYSWTAPVGAVWTVAEQHVPEGYTVTISANETAFVITNTKQPDVPDEPDTPKTGDTAPLMLYILLTCLSGFGLLILGIALMRGKQHGAKG